MRTLTCVLLPAMALAACSSDTSSNDNLFGSSVRTPLYFDTAAGAEDWLSAGVGGVVFELPDGSITANLLPEASRDTVLVDPTGETCGIGIVPPRAGSTFVAVHLFIPGGAVVAQRADGTTGTVTLPSTDLRIPIHGGYAPGEPGGLHIRCDTTPVLRAGSGGMHWTPVMSARQTSDIPVMSSAAQVVTIDLAARSALIEMPSLGGLAFDLQFDENTRLVGDDGRVRQVDDFLRECVPGSELAFDAVLHGDRALRCESAHRRGHSGGDRLIGRIATIDHATETCTVDVQMHGGQMHGGQMGGGQMHGGQMGGGQMHGGQMGGGHRGGGQTYDPITVDASAAVVFAEHRGSRPTAGFGDLAAGMLVEVAGPEPSNGVMVAREIAVRGHR